MNNKSLTICIIFAILIISGERLSYAQKKTQSSGTDIYGLSLEQLSHVKIHTANRTSGSVETSPAVVTVITRKEIEQRGYRTLYQALNRVPGFYMGHHNAIELIGSRGFIQDQNTNYLLLIDGHSQINRTTSSLMHQHLYPNLYNVERIEIIRGPGSTLWGDSALMGIINIITKNAKDFDNGKSPAGTFRVSSQYEFDNQQQSHNIQWGKACPNGDGVMTSLTYFNSDTDWYRCYAPGDTGLLYDPENVKNTNKNWDFSSSHDFQFKANWQDFTLLGRHSSVESIHPFTPNGTHVKKEFDFHFLEATYISDELFGFLTVNPRISFDYNSSGTGHTANGSTTWCTELLLNCRLFKNSHILCGANLSRSNFDTSSLYTQDGRQDDNQAIFVELNYAEIKNWWLTLGGRYDVNKGITDDTSFLPRFSLAWRFHPDFTLKYSYNTGFVRPSLFQSINTFSTTRNEQIIGAFKGQTSKSHDLQISFQNETMQFSADFFYMTIDNFIAWIGKRVVYDNQAYRLWNQNTGKVTSKGMELEGRYKWNADLSLTLNLTFADAKFNNLKQNVSSDIPVDFSGAYWVSSDKTMCNMPKYLWNLGVNYNVTPKIMADINYRGWHDAVVKWTNKPTYKRIGPGHYLDLNFTFDGLILPELRMNIFANLDLNRTYTPSGTYGGVTESFGNKYGFQVSYTF